MTDKATDKATQILPLPILATVKAAYRDVFGDLASFARVAWLMALMLVLFVEVPTLVVTEAVYKSIHPEKKVEASINPQAKLDIPEPEKASPDKTTDAKPADKEMSEQAKQIIAMEQSRRVPPEFLVIMMALNILGMAFVFSFSVAWYRQLLFAEKKGHTVIFKIGKNEWNFALTSMKAGMVLSPVVFVLFAFILAALPGFSDGKPESLQDNWPLFATGSVLIIYLTSRLSMSYPLTVMGQTEAPIKQSWILTERQAGRIVLGNLAMVVPLLVVAFGVLAAIGYAFSQAAPPVPEIVDEETRITFTEHLVYKSIGTIGTMFLVGLISAFYARTYAFLVRSNQADITPQ